MALQAIDRWTARRAPAGDRLARYDAESRRALDALIKKCRQQLDQAKLPPGPKADFRREHLFWDTIRVLEQARVPLRRTNNGVLARVLRVMLAAADEIDGVPPRPRADLKERIRAWMQAADAFDEFADEFADFLP